MISESMVTESLVMVYAGAEVSYLIMERVDAGIVKSRDYGGSRVSADIVVALEVLDLGVLDWRTGSVVNE